MIEAILQYLFHSGHNGTYIHRAPLLVSLLKEHPDKVQLEYLQHGNIRAWTPDGYKKFVLDRPIKFKPNPKEILAENTKQMILALEAGDVKKILELRKQIKEMNNL